MLQVKVQARAQRENLSCRVESALLRHQVIILGQSLAKDVR